MDIERIISCYLNGELSEKDRKKLEDWLRESPTNREQFETLKKVWETPFNFPKVLNIEDEQDHIWNRINRENGRLDTFKSSRNTIAGLFLRYAAIFIIAIGFGYIFWFNTKPKPVESTSTQIIKRENPLGQKSKIQLPDGTTVWLNAGSELTYSREFNASNRSITLRGEAYFEVIKNPELPFEVFTEDLVIVALGTSFNVKAFHEDGLKKIALRTGKVRVECLDSSYSNCQVSYLDPGQMAVFDEQLMNIKITSYNGTDPFAWKDGKIVLRHASFEEVVTTLERWYNVKINVSGSLSQEWDYTTSFDNEVLENILESLKFSEKIDYVMEGTTITIKL